MTNVVVDSFGWIEFFSDGSLAGKYAAWIEKASPQTHFTPSVVLYEVYKKVKKEHSEEQAVKDVAFIKGHTQAVALDERLALEAADLSLSEELPFADAVIMATARKVNAIIITSDPHFKDLSNVKFIR